MPFLNPGSEFHRESIEKAVGLIAKAAEKQGTPLKVVAEYLPPVAGSYMAHVWVTPSQIVNTNIKVFQKCMEI